ncbi:helix-turn-helix domain-containing protein [Pantoea sp. Al-1710]|uniref:Helix-turn-helix domain-containing protein n=1 Tax=Candidatus Pantoea communis TaxID=2608354 RepID=A0ABX0RI45_9GAMM|nr:MULTISPECIES: helix-turn-helix domain-containing protein [Pantoea]NIG12984.1 helix-turn-helix domain-containing protein [Pantoea sp. Cy-640]NIG17315.1 helix-turn-helix domain-containing protein [Pantoea communis]
MRYPVDVMATSCGFIVFCRDLQEAQGYGITKTEALTSCQDALIAVFDEFFCHRVPIPLPSNGGDETIEIPCSIAAKVMLLNEVIEQNVSQTDLAKMLNLPRQEITRIFNLSHTTKIDTIQKALTALGKTLLIRVV